MVGRYNNDSGHIAIYVTDEIMLHTGNNTDGICFTDNYMLDGHNYDKFKIYRFKSLQ